ncbi:unnamed protein product, partial [marine sediment metagenome]
INKTIAKWQKIKPDWCIYQDADEFITISEFLSLRQFIEIRDRMGYNVINQIRVPFFPTGEEDFSQGDPRKVFKYYNRKLELITDRSERIFKYCDDMDLLSSGAHFVKRPDKRVSMEDWNNPILHYSLRQNCEKKVRKICARLPEEECARGWHVHQRELVKLGKFRWDKSLLCDISRPDDPLNKFYPGRNSVIDLRKLIGDGKFRTDGSDMRSFVALLAGLVIASNAQLVFEIGTGFLNSAKSFLYGLEITGGKLVSCDPEKRWGNFSHSQFEFIQKKSGEVAKNWKDKVDILLIDGAHDYTSAKDDFENFYPFVKSKGHIVFHDTNFPQHFGCEEFAREVNGLNKMVFAQQPGLTIFQKD